MLTPKERNRRNRREQDPRLNSLYGRPLSPRQRQVLEVLTSGEQARTYKEAAELLGIAEGTLHDHLQYARRKQPERYAEMMEKRAQQLEQRKVKNFEKAKAKRRAYYHDNKPLTQKVMEFIELVRAVRKP